MRALGAWGAAFGLSWDLTAPWTGGGLTPLHIAALLLDPVEVAVALTGAPG